MSILPSSADANVSACILSRNRWPTLQVTLRKLQDISRRHASLLRDIIVVDNGSTDGTPDYIRQHFPHTTLIEIGTNSGIGGWNHALSTARGKYCLMLDDDAFIEEDALLKAVNILEHRPTTGILAFRILSPRDDTDFSVAYPTGTLSFWGCGALIRSKMLSDIGLYEKSLFFQAFELALSIRARNRGWDIDMAPRLPVWHITSIQTAQSKQKYYYSRRNLLIIATSCFSGARLFNVLRDQAKITWAWGVRSYGVLFLLRLIVDGLVMGLLRRVTYGLPRPSIQRLYRRKFAEFASFGAQRSLWKNSERTYWRRREAYYPEISTPWSPHTFATPGEFDFSQLDESWVLRCGDNYFRLESSATVKSAVFHLSCAPPHAQFKRFLCRVSSDTANAPGVSLAVFNKDGGLQRQSCLEDLHLYPQIDISINPATFGSMRFTVSPCTTNYSDGEKAPRSTVNFAKMRWAD